jgi:hypothetical protein
MRLDAVELKWNVAQDHVPATIELLGIGDNGSQREIFFAEDPGMDTVTLPLLEGSVVLRVRSSANGKRDSTVKLRPCRRSQLTDGWLDAPRGSDDDPKLEADWVGDRKVLAASITSKPGSDSLDDVREGRARVGTLFSAEQQAFLDACADIRVNVNGLVLLGPIAATRWDRVDIDGIEVVAERWRIGTELDFLELSIRISPPDAVETQRAIDHGVHQLGIVLDDRQATKTRLVLEHLAASASEALRVPTGSRGPGRAASPVASGAPKRVPLPADDIDA